MARINVVLQEIGRLEKEINTLKREGGYSLLQMKERQLKSYKQELKELRS